jgi:hypothetical protein
MLAVEQQQRSAAQRRPKVSLMNSTSLCSVNITGQRREHSKFGIGGQYLLFDLWCKYSFSYSKLSEAALAAVYLQKRRELNEFLSTSLPCRVHWSFLCKQVLPHSALEASGQRM